MTRRNPWFDFYHPSPKMAEVLKGQNAAGFLALLPDAELYRD